VSVGDGIAALTGLRFGPASKGAVRQLVVLCHGVGADGHDLIDLAPTWSRALPDALFVAPDGPQRYDQGPTGRQWFSLRDRTPAVLDAAARQSAPLLLAYIDAELVQAGLPPDAVAMMGFSQGAMMVLHAGLRRPTPPRGIMAYSGALLNLPGFAAECTGHPPVLLVHGKQDDVVPFAQAGAAESALVRLGMPVQTLWCPKLGHGIDDAGLSAGALFLQRLFA
jgi:phospholipase/carboxylesterase